jgi:hypothetical protein
MKSTLRRLSGFAALISASPLALLAQEAAAAAPTVVKSSLLHDLSAPSILPLWFCSALIVLFGDRPLHEELDEADRLARRS